MRTIITKDKTSIWFKDWGTGQPIVFSHGWPLSSDAFEDQMFFLASHGYRVIAHDRRGHGRSSQPWQGKDMNHYADDRGAGRAPRAEGRRPHRSFDPAPARSRAIPADTVRSAWPRRC